MLYSTAKTVVDCALVCFMLSHKINYILNIGRVYDIGWAVEPKTSSLDNTPAGRRGTKEYLLQAEMLASVTT